MKVRICFIVALTNLLMLAHAAGAADPKPQSNPVDAPRKNWIQYPPRIIALKYADSQYVAAAVSGLFEGVGLRAIERPNGLIFQGSDESYERAKQLIAQLDIADDNATGDPSETYMIPVLNRRVNELIGELVQVFDRRGSRFAADRDRNVIIVRGPGSFVKEVQVLVSKLDTPTPIAIVDFAFFLTSAEKAKSDSPIPADLADVAKELERFGNIRLLGRFSTTVSEGQKFKIEGGIASDYRARVEGVLESSSADGSDRIGLNANVDLLRRITTPKDQPERTETRAGYSLSTTTIVRRGNYTAVGVAPTGEDIGQTGILVMQVRK